MFHVDVLKLVCKTHILLETLEVKRVPGTTYIDESSAYTKYLAANDEITEKMHTR